MKNILNIMAIIALLSSCSAPKTIVIQEQSIIVDFESFTGSDFRITPFEYASSEFEVIGTIYKEFSYRRTAEYMIEETIAAAKRLGSNGLMKFDIISNFNENNLTSYIVKGVAVRFKDNKEKR